MSTNSDKSEDTEEFIRSIREELELHTPPYENPFEQDELLQLIQDEEPPYHLNSTLTSPMKNSEDITHEYDVTLQGDIDKVLQSLGHLKTTECYLTDEENEVINATRDREDKYKLSESIDTPMNSTPCHKITSYFQPESLLTSKSETLLAPLVPPSPPEVFMTPMRDEFSRLPNTDWSDREIKGLQNKLFRQTLQHKSELDELEHRESAAKQRLEKSQKENQDLIQSMKSQVSSLQQKIREMQSEKVNIVSQITQQTENKPPNGDEISQIKYIADQYKLIVREQDSKLSSLEQMIESKNAEIYTLNCQMGDKEKILEEMADKLKDQARNFSVEQSRKETEASEMLNKTQKHHHREKVLSVAKIQDDLNQTHSEEVLQLKQFLSDEKNRALSRLEESFTQKISKSEENCKRVEKELETALKKVEHKDDVIKNMDIQHKKEVHNLNAEIQKLQSNLHRTTIESTQNKSQAVARARQECEETNLHRIQHAVGESQKSHQAEIQKLKANLKRVTDELSSAREQNNQLVRRGKDRLAAQSQFEERLTHQLADELHQHSIVGISSGQQRRSHCVQKRIGGSMSSLVDLGNPKKESVENALKVLKIANEDLRKRVRELEQKLDAEKKKTKQNEMDHQVKVKQLKKEIEQKEAHSKQENGKEKEKTDRDRATKLTFDMKELESSNASLREYIHTLEEEIKFLRENIMNDPRVIEALTLLSKLQKRLKALTEEKSHLQEEIQKLRDIIEKHNISPHSNSTQIFTEKIREYSLLQSKYKVLLREKMELERCSL